MAPLFIIMSLSLNVKVWSLTALNTLTRTQKEADTGSEPEAASQVRWQNPSSRDGLSDYDSIANVSSE